MKFPWKYISAFNPLCKRDTSNKLLSGDLIFFFSTNIFSWLGSFSSAVSSSNDIPANHVAMITRVNASFLEIIESKPGYGVVLGEYTNICDLIDTPFLTWIEVYHVNISSEIRGQAVSCARDQIGAAYNDIFSSDLINSSGEYSFYCSQLVQFAYNEAACVELFPFQPMRFSGENGKIIQYWIDYYHDLGIPEVPEGQNGSHPGGLYSSDLLIEVL